MSSEPAVMNEHQLQHLIDEPNHAGNGDVVSMAVELQSLRQISGIKPLAWAQDKFGHSADSILGTWWVRNPFSDQRVQLESPFGHSMHESAASAIAFAEEIYRTRILSALETPPLAAQDGEKSIQPVIHIQRWEKGDGLRVWSDDLKGLILSGHDTDKVLLSIYPAVVAIMDQDGVQWVETPIATTPPSQAIDAEDGEAVAWQHRIWFDDTQKWSDWWDGKRDTTLANDWQERPLYTHPAAGRVSVSDEATHRHVKSGGDYVLIGIGKMQAGKWKAPTIRPDPGGRNHWTHVSVDMREVAIYRSVEDGSLWARPREEFEDGRFEALAGEAP